MSRERYRSGANALHQRGFALIAMLALAAMIAAFLIAIGLDRSRAEVLNEREERNMSALQQAKAALIAFAADTEGWQTSQSLGTDQPGALPCPAGNNNGISNDNGISDCLGPANTSIIGRLPWKTMGIDDLRDATGERLWYAVSYNFRKQFGATVINSDTPGQLTVNGTAPASQVVAVVFAPGSPLALLGQTRPSATTNAAHNTPSNYLEGFDITTDPVNFTFTSAQSSDTFNDRLVVITQAELMAAVEPVVAARLEIWIKPLILAYYTAWGAYPFAATFDPGQPQSALQGATGQASGLLPLTNLPGFIAWKTSPSSSISVTKIGGSGTLNSFDCSSSNSIQIVCQIDYDGSGGDRPVILLQATLLHAGSTFAKPVAAGDESMTDHDGNPTTWNAGPTVTNQAQADGSGLVAFVGTLESVSTNNKRVFITIPRPSPAYLVITSANRGPGGLSPNPNGAWFISNQWYKQTYYAVSSEFVPGGSGPPCNSRPPPPAAPPVKSCLRVDGLPAPSAGPAPTPDNKQAILVLAGRAFGPGRPSTDPTKYFEKANLAAALGTVPFAYQHRFGSPTDINDRVVILSP